MMSYETLSLSERILIGDRFFFFKESPRGNIKNTIQEYGNNVIQPPVEFRDNPVVIQRTKPIFNFDDDIIQKHKV